MNSNLFHSESVMNWNMNDSDRFDGIGRLWRCDRNRSGTTNTAKPRLFRIHNKTRCNRCRSGKGFPKKIASRTYWSFIKMLVTKDAEIESSASFILVYCSIDQGSTNELVHSTDLSNSNFLFSGRPFSYPGSHVAEYLLKHGALKVGCAGQIVQRLWKKPRSTQALTRHFEFMEGDIRNEFARTPAQVSITLATRPLGSVPRSIKEPVYFNGKWMGGFTSNISRPLTIRLSSLYIHRHHRQDEPTLLKNWKTGLVNVYHPMLLPKNKWTLCRFLQMCMVSMWSAWRYFSILVHVRIWWDLCGSNSVVCKGIINRMPVYINGDGTKPGIYILLIMQYRWTCFGMLTQNKEAINKVLQRGCWRELLCKLPV